MGSRKSIHERKNLETFVFPINWTLFSVRIDQSDTLLIIHGGL